MAALVANGGAQVCHATYNTCISSDAGPTASNNICNTEAPPSGCESTVSQYVACLPDQMAATKLLLGQLGPQICDLPDAGAIGVITSVPKPASCQVIQWDCPNDLLPDISQ